MVHCWVCQWTFLSGEYLAKLHARRCLYRALRAPDMHHTAKRRRIRQTCWVWRETAVANCCHSAFNVTWIISKLTWTDCNMITWRHHVSSVLKRGNYWNQLLHKVVWQHMHMQDVVGSLEISHSLHCRFIRIWQRKNFDNRLTLTVAVSLLCSFFDLPCMSIKFRLWFHVRFRVHYSSIRYNTTWCKNNVFRKYHPLLVW